MKIVILTILVLLIWGCGGDAPKKHILKAKKQELHSAVSKEFKSYKSYEDAIEKLGVGKLNSNFKMMQGLGNDSIVLERMRTEDNPNCEDVFSLELEKDEHVGFSNFEITAVTVCKHN